MEIQVSVLNKVADVVGKPIIVCDNSDYTIKFAFDSEWDAFPAKTAIFVYKRGAQYLSQEVTFSGDTVSVPPLQKVAGVSVGVYSGDVHTTTPAWIPCLASAKSHSAAHDNPPQDVYDQLVDLVNSGAVKGEDGISPHIGDNGNWYIGDVDTGVSASGGTGSATWDSISGKPDTFPPSEHNHDDRYYTEQEIDSQIQNLRNEIPSLTENITGITVDGTDLPVEDGKVALPIGSTTDLGVLKGAAGHGINVVNGEIRINGATNGNIDARTANKPINTINLNYAVKAALTDEKRISGLTDAEKKNACSTIGSVYDGRYELIEKITLTEDVTQISRAASPDGEAYNFKKLFIDYNGAKPMSRFRVQGTYKYGNNTFNYNCYIASNHAMGYIEIDASNILKYYGAGGGAAGYTTQWCTTGNNAQIQKADSITSLIIEGTQALYAGTVINIYGVRA